jgi:hypothetical protein
MVCIEASEYTTGTVLGVHNSLEDCEQQCGVCCIPTCPSNLNSFKTTQEDGCVVQSLIPFEDSTSISLTAYFVCGAGGYGDWFYTGPDINNNDAMYFSQFRGDPNAEVKKFPDASHWVDLVISGLEENVHQTWSVERSYNLVKSGSKPDDLTWAPGYPNGVYFIETRTFASQVGAGSMDIGAKWAVDEPGGEPIPTDGNGAVYFSRTARKVKYFQCVDGILIDQTSEAFSNGSNNKTISYNDYPYGAAGGNPDIVVNVGTLVEYDYTVTTVIGQCFLAAEEGDTEGLTLDPCCTSYGGSEPCNAPPGYGQYSSFSSTFVNESKFGEFSFLENLPTYPSIADSETQGATTLIYECNDTITQSGCLLGGVLNPSGVPLGIWQSGQNCTTFDCNA